MLDVIILSNAKTKELQYTTLDCIQSLLNSATAEINIIVIESCSGFSWDSSFRNEFPNDIEKIRTIYIRSQHESFNYNRFANLGAFSGKSEYICIANNDLIFYPAWFWEVVKADYPVCSPRCPDDKRQQNIVANEIGEQVGRHLSGWCFVLKRTVWEQIGGFDEDFSFWCADNSLMEQLLAIGIKPMVLANSIVKHLGSKTLKTMDNRDELTRAQVLKYNRKYNRNLFGWGT